MRSEWVNLRLDNERPTSVMYVPGGMLVHVAGKIGAGALTFVPGDWHVLKKWIEENR